MVRLYYFYKARWEETTVHSMMMSLDSGSKTPMYEQIYRSLAADIRSGALRAGERLPSKRALSAHLCVSLVTVETAYALLVSEGYILSRPRSGFFVSDFVTLSAPERAAAAPARPVEATSAAPATGKPELDFSTAAVDVSLFPYASWARLYREAVCAHPELLQRGERQGDRALRQALGAFLSEYRGVVCAPEQIVVGAGLEYLFGLLLELMPAETVFGAEDPGYAGFRHAVHAAGRPLRMLPLDGDGLSVPALEQSDVSVAFITPSHQFPLGLTMPADRRSRLLRWASEAPERWLVEDDYDSEFRYLSRPLPALQGMDGGARVVYLGTFSRSLAPAIRAAYMVLPPALLERYQALPGHGMSTVSRYEQHVLARFLAEGYYARYLRRVGNLYRRRREALLAALEGIDGVSVSGSGGGIHLLIRNPRFSEAELLERAAAEGVALRGLSGYCQTQSPPPSTLVAGYGGLRDEQIPEAAARLKRAWE